MGLTGPCPSCCGGTPAKTCCDDSFPLPPDNLTDPPPDNVPCCWSDNAKITGILNAEAYLWFNDSLFAWPEYGQGEEPFYGQPVPNCGEGEIIYDDPNNFGAYYRITSDQHWRMKITISDWNFVALPQWGAGPAGPVCEFLASGSYGYRCKCDDGWGTYEDISNNNCTCSRTNPVTGEYETKFGDWELRSTNGLNAQLKGAYNTTPNPGYNHLLNSSAVECDLFSDSDCVPKTGEAKPWIMVAASVRLRHNKPPTYKPDPNNLGNVTFNDPGCPGGWYVTASFSSYINPACVIYMCTIGSASQCVGGDCQSVGSVDFGYGDCKVLGLATQGTWGAYGGSTKVTGGVTINNIYNYCCRDYEYHAGNCVIGQGDAQGQCTNPQPNLQLAGNRASSTGGAWIKRVRGIQQVRGIQIVDALPPGMR